MCAHLVEGLGIRAAEGLGIPCGLPSLASWESGGPWCLRDGTDQDACRGLHSLFYSSTQAGIIHAGSVAAPMLPQSTGAQGCSGWAVSSSPHPLCTYQLIGVLGPGQVAHL